ncbi:MAG: hypothetical protein U7123_23850 [Potamolinea sp.]
MVAPTEIKTATGSVTNRKTDVYTGPAFKMEHTYWGQYTTAGNGFVSSELKVTNTSDVPISVRVYLDLDDTGIFWDANVRNSQGNPVESKWIEIGIIQPQASSTTSYWWGVVNLSGIQYVETFEVTFNLAPEIKIDYTNIKPFNNSKSTVTTMIA